MRFFIALYLIFIVIPCFGSPEDCFNTGLKYEKLALEKDLDANYMQKAQDNFLCAEKQGNVFAGYKAATLSDGGVAKEIDSTELKRLYLNAANSGNADAALIMSRIVCGDKFDACIDPGSSKKWMIESAKLKKCEAYNSLGYFYEKGIDGTVDLRKAVSCYRSSAACGNKLGEINYKRIEKLGDFSRIDECI